MFCLTLSCSVVLVPDFSLFALQTIRSDPAFGAFQILKLFMDDWIALNVLRNVALSTNSVAASVEPSMQQQQQQQSQHDAQFLALSPGGSTFATSSHNSIHPHHSQMMAHTPTTASMIAAMGDPFGTSGMGMSMGGPFAFDPLTTFDFGGSASNHGMVDMSGSHSGGMGGGVVVVDSQSNDGADSLMSSPNHSTADLVKVEGA